MRSTVPLFCLSFLGAASATRIPRNQDQPSKRTDVTDVLQTLREEITRLEDALREDYLHLASLLNAGASPTRSTSTPDRPGKNQPGGPKQPSFPQITTTLIPQATSSTSKASVLTEPSPDSTLNFISAVTSSASTLLDLQVGSCLVDLVWK
jgi:hypothetical protein